MRFSEIDVGDGLAGVCVDGNRFTLTVQVGGNGAGNVSSNPPGITCSAGACTGRFPEGSLIELFAVATMGSFLGWADSCRGREGCAVTMDRDHDVGALFGVPGAALWVRQFGGASSQTGAEIRATADGNLVAVGSFSETMTLGGMELRSNGQSDAFVVKMDTTGEILWARRFGGTVSEAGIAIDADELNNVYVTGWFEGTADFGTGPLSTDTRASFVLKLDANGNPAWARKIDATLGATPNGIAARESGVVVVGGYAGSIAQGGTTYTSSGSNDVYVAKLTTAGAPVWLKSFGGARSDGATGAAIDSASNVIVSGAFVGDVNFGGDPMTSNSEFASDGFLLKLAGANGNHLFSKEVGGAGDDTAVGVAVDSTNGILLSGSFEGAGDFGCLSNPVASQAGLSDAFLAKYTQAGACVWAKGFGGTGQDRVAAGITVNAQDDVAISGRFEGTVSFGGQVLVSASSFGKDDIFAARFNSNGEHLNSIRAGGTGHESGRGITETADGRFFVTGDFEGFAEFGGEALTSNGADAYVLALAPL